MKWSWDTAFKIDTMIIGPCGALWLAWDQSQTFAIAHPDDVQNFLTTQLTNTRPLRIMLDWPHVTVHTPVPQLKWWERRQFIRHAQTSHNSAESFLFQQQRGKQSLSGLRVDIDPMMLQWFAALSVVPVPIEGIYSLPYECGRAMTTPILFATKTIFDELRFIFADGQGAYFHRIVSYVDETAVCQEIERTLYYLSRKYNLNLHEISVTSTSYDRELSSYVRSWNVLETAKNCPEELLLSLILNNPNRLQKRHHHTFKKAWQRFLRPRLLTGFGIPIAAILAIGIGAMSWYVHSIRSHIETLDQHIAQWQQHANQKTYNQNTARLSKIKGVNEVYLTLKNEHIPLLTILRKLMSPQHAVQIKQLVLVSQDQSNPRSKKLIIEFRTQQPSMTTLEQRQCLKHYAEFLSQQFPEAKIHRNHDFNGEDINAQDNFETLIAATLQLDNIQ